MLPVLAQAGPAPSRTRQHREFRGAPRAVLCAQSIVLQQPGSFHTLAAYWFIESRKAALGSRAEAAGPGHPAR